MYCVIYMYHMFCIYGHIQHVYKSVIQRTYIYNVFYRLQGGMKAVLMTDTLQLVIMLAGCLTMVIAGTLSAGGPSEIYNVNKLSGRLDVLE